MFCRSNPCCSAGFTRLSVKLDKNSTTVTLRLLARFIVACCTPPTCIQACLIMDCIRKNINHHILYSFFPRDSSRLRVRWFVATHYITQMVTGHGWFKERMHRLGLSEDPPCGCSLSGPEKPEHIFYECTSMTASETDFGWERVPIEGVAWPHSWISGCGEGATKTSRRTLAERCS